MISRSALKCLRFAHALRPNMSFRLTTRSFSAAAASPFGESWSVGDIKKLDSTPDHKPPS